MSTNTKSRLEAGVIQITFGTFTSNFFVAAMPEQMKAIAVTGLVSDEKNHDASMDDARRIAACWNVCRGFDTDHLENIDMVGDTLKVRFEALKGELKAPPLAQDHKGMMVDYSGMLRQIINALPRSSSFQAEMLRQFKTHLEELGKRFYAGDFKAVDEFLQLYCVAYEDRKRVLAEQNKEAA